MPNLTQHVSNRWLFASWSSLACLGLFFASPAAAAEPRLNVSFLNDVVPVLTKAGCNSGACHAKAGQGQNGFQLTRTITRDARYSSIPVIMCTSKNQETDRVWGLRQGARDYVVKPVSAPILRARIGSLLRRAYPPRDERGGPFSVSASRFDVLHHHSGLRCAAGMPG